MTNSSTFENSPSPSAVRAAAEAARAAAVRLVCIPTETKNAALIAIADALLANEAEILAANRADLDAARDASLAGPLLKRLTFDAAKLRDSVAGLRSLVALPDPVGRVLARTELDSRLVLSRVTCPIGVVGVIFESRPDALVQISALCLKSGNAVLLKGGSEALRTNRVLARAVHDAACSAGLPEGWLRLLETRADVAEMLRLDDLVDLIVPRGSNAFVRHIMANSSIPVLGHADGICHVYVDAKADPAMAVDIVEDAKCQYVSVCNAAETLLVHRDVAGAFLPALRERLAGRVALRCCPRSLPLLGGTPATDADWDTEYLDYILSVRVVDSLDEAVDHINAHGSRHTDAIVTADADAAESFMDRVDSGSVFWNASTRFADGYRYGLGAEVGISTSKLHARGPVGLDGLVTYKWKLRGGGHTVAPYASGAKTFTHRPLQ